MSSLPRRPNFVLAWIVVVMAAMSMVSNWLFKATPSSADRVSASHFGARLDPEHALAQEDRLSPSTTPAAAPTRPPSEPSPLDLGPMPLIGLSPDGWPLLPLADGEASTSLPGNLPPFLPTQPAHLLEPTPIPGEPAVVPIAAPLPTPTQGPEQMPSFRRQGLDRSPSDAVASSSSSASSQSLRFHGGPGQDAWRERLAIESLPRQRVRILVQLHGDFHGQARELLAAWQASAPDRHQDSDEEEGSKEQPIQRLKPLLPFLNQTAKRLEQQPEGQVERGDLSRAMRVWLRQRPGGLELLAELDRDKLEQLAVAYGPRYPQLQDLLASLSR